MSKQAKSILPLRLILGGLIQKMPSFFKRFWLYTIATVIAAGSAGGTTIVTISKVRTIVSFKSACRINKVNRDKLF